MTDRRFSFVVAVNDREVLSQNLMSSPMFNGKHGHQIIEKHDFRSAATAYNSAIAEADNEILCFVHQDVYLPDSWLSEVNRSLDYLENKDPSWGVLGCFGSAKGRQGGVGQVYTTVLGVHGNEIHKPEAVETVDEIVIIIRRSSGLRFDPSLPHFHLYGTDICLSAKENGMICYAIWAPCIHNTNQLVDLPNEFYQCYYHIKKRWRKYLPIYTSCIKISRYDREVRERKLRSTIRKLTGVIIESEKRIDDSRIITKILEKDKPPHLG
jgi:hypothetical protein